MGDSIGQIQSDQWKRKHKSATRNRMVLINEFIVFVFRSGWPYIMESISALNS